MIRIYMIEELCCANCAAKIEKKLSEYPGVEEAVITFATRQLKLTAADPDALISRLQEIARSIEPDVRFVPRDDGSAHRNDHHGHHEHCGCGYDHHEHGEHCTCGHDHHDHEHCGCDHGHDDHDHCSCGHDHHDHHEHCSCGHDRHDHCSCGHDHHGHNHDHGSESPLWIGAGALLFAVGLITEGWVRMAVCALAFILLGWDVVRNALRGLFRGRVMDENFLMTVASVGAFFIGNAPEGVGVMLFYRVGEFFEHRAVERSRSQIMDAVDLRPETVTLAQTMAQIPARDAKIGDLLLVRPGDRIPLDGTVVSGESRLDTAPITGESVPVAVRPGSEVLSGCVNTVGQLTLRVDKPLEKSMVTRILNSVENAAAGKPRMDRFITRFARVYTPVVVLIAVLTAVIPSLVTGDWQHWVYTALSFLVMSCPCALVLSVPLAFFAGIGAGSKKGILFKGGATMEAMSKIRGVVMDKTGTLTKGDFRVQEIRGGEELLALCAACEEMSTHPIAASITAAARERGLSWSGPDALHELPGRGIQAQLDGKTVLVGNEKLLQERGVAYPRPESRYGTWVLVAVDGAYAGALLISDTVKPDAAAAVEQLRKNGYAVAILTGDAQQAAEAVASELGIDRCYASMLPDQKLETLRSIRREQGAVMFVGDGINDAPVLAGADVGAAMGSGADAAIEAADVVFMTGQAEAVPLALRIAKGTAAIAWQNVIFALGIKLAVMILGLMGIASMWLAVFADSGVAMLCVLNSIRLLYSKK